MSRCPENQNKGHFFDADGFCRFCLLWNPDAIFVKREVRKDERRDEAARADL